jgi:hypothetical protein
MPGNGRSAGRQCRDDRAVVGHDAAIYPGIGRTAGQPDGKSSASTGQFWPGRRDLAISPQVADARPRRPCQTQLDGH